MDAVEAPFLAFVAVSLALGIEAHFLVGTAGVPAGYQAGVGMELDMGCWRAAIDEQDAGLGKLCVKAQRVQKAIELGLANETDLFFF